MKIRSKLHIAVASATAIIASLFLVPMAGAAQPLPVASSTTMDGWNEAPFTPPAGAPIADLASNCEVRVDWAHISTTISPKAAKVNGTAFCTVGQFDIVQVYVTLWKVGEFFPYNEASTEETGYDTNSQGNENTFKYCADSTQSTYYGEITATATIDGVPGWTAGPVYSSQDVSLACGT
jgi:hypothetical protein